MNKMLLKLLVAGGLSLLLGSSVWGDVTPTNTWTSFYGSVFTRDNNDALIPAPAGTVIDAYTQSGLHVGTYTVSDAMPGPGKYPFMPVYGDDNTTLIIDGAQAGSIIFFRINDKDASPGGPNPIIWGQSYPIRNVDLSMLPSSLKVSMQPGTVKGQQIKPGDIVHFEIPVKNTGDGTDFYALSCSSSRPWQLISDTGLYCEPGHTIMLKVDLYVPDTADKKVNVTINYIVQSGTDTSLHVSGKLTGSFSTTDTPEDRSVLPGGFMLHQNYPNPYNPTTMISYDLSAASDVTLEIFNLLGRKMDHFELGRQTAGNHSFEYSAGQLPSGIYFYRIQAGDFSDMKKMVLMK